MKLEKTLKELIKEELEIMSKRSAYLREAKPLMQILKEENPEGIK